MNEVIIFESVTRFRQNVLNRRGCRFETNVKVCNIDVTKYID